MNASQRELIVIGAGGHAKVVADAAACAGFRILGFGDNDASKRGKRLLEWSVITTGDDEAIALCRERNASVVIAVGDNATRRNLFLKMVEHGVDVATVVHPRAVVASSAKIDRGSVLFAGVIVNPDSIIGANVILNTGATIDHDNVLGDHVHVSPGAHTGGTVTVGEGTHIGIGATVKNNIAIGAWSIIGAGAVVVRDIGDRVVAYGNPARVHRSVAP